jgi:hypothetical protein
MSALMLFFWVLVAVAVAYLVYRAAVATRAYFQLRGKRVVTCPETHEKVTVAVDARRAAAQTFGGIPHLRLKECTRWPEKQNCGQDCLRELEANPQTCLVWNIVDEWYDGKPCFYCGKPFGHINWHDHRPAVLVPASLAQRFSARQKEGAPLVIRPRVPEHTPEQVDVFELPDKARMDAAPAPSLPAMVTLQWTAIPPEKLGEVFATARPVCWDCHIAESFRREHTELVTDRLAH